MGALVVVWVGYQRCACLNEREHHVLRGLPCIDGCPTRVQLERARHRLLDTPSNPMTVLEAALLRFEWLQLCYSISAQTRYASGCQLDL